MDGLEAARHMMRMPTPPAVVFTTAYDEHALAAFEANAIDYLLKPIRAKRLQQALNKALSLSAAQSARIAAVSATSARTHVSGLVHGNLTLIAIDEILYFQADQGYVDVVWTQGSMLIEESLRSLEEEFDDQFLRIHRNALVAVRHVAAVTRDRDGNYFVGVRGREAQLPVSRRLLNHVKSRLR
jgi:two-component system response regulator AlgR